MKGDFSRDSFDAGRHVYRVLMQQGRVQLDADWNEQAAVLLHRLEAVVRDAFGAVGGPAAACGFEISDADDAGEDGDFSIGAGRYYVDGILAENGRRQRYSALGGAPLEGGHYIVYLDLWEEFVAPQQDPASLDPALDGLDTTARSRLEWRVRAHRVEKLPTRDEIGAGWPAKFLGPQSAAPRVRLAATVAGTSDGSDPALGPQQSGYHGDENRLYRVEIHEPGTSAGGATFKWSRDNGSVTFAIRSVVDKVVTLESFGSDAHADLVAGDWVEIADDDDAGATKPSRGLFAVAHVDPAARTVTTKLPPGYAYDEAKHPVLRRWDQRSAPIAIAPNTTDDDARIPLENGIAIRFGSLPEEDDAVYRAGDYWLIPARTADGGSLLWPVAADGRPELREPAGIRHYYAPLAGIRVAATGKTGAEPRDYRTSFLPLTARAKPVARGKHLPLTELGLEREHGEALTDAGIHTLENVAEAGPEKIAHALSAWTHIKPLDLIAKAKALLYPSGVREDKPKDDWWQDR